MMVKEHHQNIRINNFKSMKNYQKKELYKKDKKEEKLSKLKPSTYSPTDTQKEALVTEKEAAASGAIFIWVNSLVGVISRAQTGTFDMQFIFPLSIAVLIGGTAGSYLGAQRFEPKTIQKVMGSVIIIAIIMMIINAIIITLIEIILTRIV